jgi:hypothetical protein
MEGPLTRDSWGAFSGLELMKHSYTKGDLPMKQLLLGAALVGVGTVIGAVSSDNTNATANAQFAPPSVQSGDALWHLPRFGEQGWFLHANNGRVRACNMDKVSVVGERAAPRCSKWTVD